MTSQTKDIPRPRTQLVWINYFLIGLVIILGTQMASEVIDSFVKVHCIRK